MKNLGNLNDFIFELDFDKNDLIKFEDLVICFDDLERLNAQFHLEDFIGFVNSLVENEKAKILIIANENKIEKENYNSLKEKVIGNSIEFIPDMSNSFDSLIAIRFSESPSYTKYLIENKTLILDIFKKNSSNIRILSYSLIYFQTIFSEVLNWLPSHDIFNNKRNEILSKILKFALAISIEYKTNSISYNKRENLNLSIGFNLDISFGKSENENSINTYKSKFWEKYNYKNYNYFYFNSIYNFLTGGPIFTINEFIKELEKCYYIKDNEVLPQYELFRKLNSHEIFSLTDKEYKELTKKLLTYADQGKFDLISYMGIFYLVSRYGNPLKYNLDKLGSRIIKGIYKGKNNYKYHHHIEEYLNIDSSAENKDNLYRIRSAVVNLNDHIGSLNEKVEMERLEMLCLTNFDSFYKEVQDNNIQYNPIFQNFNVSKFYSLFLNCENNIRWQMIQFFIDRYRDPYRDSLLPEKVFLENLNLKIRKKIKSVPKSGLTNFIFTEYYKVLEKSILFLKPI